MLENMTQVTEKYGAGNETRTRDPDLGKVVSNDSQLNDKYEYSGNRSEPLNAQSEKHSSASPSHDVGSSLELCDRVIWPGLNGAPNYHPCCHWPDLCNARGCFWQYPQVGFRQQPDQRGLDL